MRPRPGFLLTSLCLALGCWTGNASSEAPTDQRANEPRELGIHEQVKRRLIQLDVTVTGPPAVIPRLTADDFELFVGNLALGGRQITDLILDRFCPAPDPPRAETHASVSPGRKDPPPRATYVFYFDRTFSYAASDETMHAMVRDLIIELVDERSPATIISGGRTIRTYAYNTSDHGELYAALEHLALDASEQANTIWYPTFGLADVREALTWSGSQVFARERAYRFQKDAIDRTYVALTRLSGVMPGLADLPLPKVLFYIGNRLNSRPGQIYSAVRGKRLDTLDIGDTDPWAAAKDFDMTIQDAASAGVRIYPIFPAGPTHSLDFEFMSALWAEHWSMRGLAEQTGGKEFFWGVPVSKIVKRIKADLSCTYLLSFDPEDNPVDERLGVDLRVTRPKVKARTRAQIVVRSPEKHREAELFAAFLTDGDAGRGERLVAEIVAADASDQSFGIVRVTLPASATSNTSWVLGIWLSREGVVRRQMVEHATVPTVGKPVVVDIKMRLEPGPFELILVAHEPEGDRVVSNRLAAEWPVLRAR